MKVKDLLRTDSDAYDETKVILKDWYRKTIYEDTKRNCLFDIKNFKQAKIINFILKSNINNFYHNDNDNELIIILKEVYE